MSETFTPIAETPTAPSNAAPGPVVGTTQPAPEPNAIPVPAADSPATETALDVSTPDSLLSSLTAPEPVAPAEKPAEAPAEEVVAEAPAELPLPTYEAFNVPEGIKLDEAQSAAFSKVLGEFENKVAATPAEAHAAAQEMGQAMLDLYANEAKAHAERHAKAQYDNWLRTRENWVSQFKEDSEIGGNRRDTTLARIGAMIELYGTRAGAEKESALRDAMTLTGAGDHPDVLRFINFCAGFAIEQPRMVAANTPKAPIQMSRAQRMYRNSIPVGTA